MAEAQRDKRLNCLEEELKEIDKVRKSRSTIVSLFVILCFSFAAVLFLEGDVELGTAVVLVILCCGIYSSVKLSRLDKRREEITAELDKLSPQPDKSWLSSMILLAVVIAAVGYFFASL